MTAKILSIFAVVCIAQVVEVDDSLFDVEFHRFTVKQNTGNCSACQTGLSDLNIIVSSSCGNDLTTLANSVTFSGKCGDSSFTSTCQDGTMSNPSSSAVKLNQNANKAHFVCILGSNAAGTSDLCSSTCNQTASGIDQSYAALGVNTSSLILYCDNCTTSSGRRSVLQDATAQVGGQLTILCPCTGLSGTDLTTCCATCFTIAACNGAVLSACACGGVSIVCSSCPNGSKDSNKLLLLLLLLLLLIPLILCCCILCCCFIRRKHKDPEINFTTFDPHPVPGPVLAQTLMPTFSVSGCDIPDVPAAPTMTGIPCNPTAFVVPSISPLY